MAGARRCKNGRANAVAGKDYRFHDHGSHDLKGFEEPSRLFEVAWRPVAQR